MDYDAVLAQILDLLQREKRLSYRVLKRRFGLDDNDLEDLKEDLIYAKQLAAEEEGRVLVWTGVSEVMRPSASMALFGAPIAHEDHALRACYAALVMQAAMCEYTEEVRRAHGLEMRMRVGLNSGEIDCMRQIATSLDEARRYERLGHVLLPAVNARATLAVCHAELGMFTEGRVLGDEGLQLAEAAAHPASLLCAYWGVSLVALRQGDVPRVLPSLERVMGMCQDEDLSGWFPRIASVVGAAYALAGRVADAVPLLTQALEQTIAEDTAEHQVFYTLSLGEAHLLAGRLEEAHALAERALAFAYEHQERGNQVYALRLLGDIAARRDPPYVEEAETHYRQALALAEELGMRPLQAHCHLGLGTLYAKLGQWEQARAELAAAIELYRAMEMTFWLPQAEAALAQTK
jgi:tetratricopeptide (TPR) repeat protein